MGKSKTENTKADTKAKVETDENVNVGSNAAQIEGAALYRVQHDPQPQVAEDNPEPQQCAEAIGKALSIIAYATTLNVNIPDPDGDREVEYASEDQDGEVVTVRCRVANRFDRMQRGLLDAILRQLDFSIQRATQELNDIKRDIRSALGNMQRSQDPAKLRGFIDGKTRWSDVIADQIAHAQLLRDAAHDAYVDLTGRPYVPYEQRRPTTVALPMPKAGEQVDPVLARAQALLNS